MENLKELSSYFQIQFPDLRFFQANKCVKVIGDAVYGFEFMPIRGQYRTFFAVYSLWAEVKKSRFESCLFLREIHDSRNLQVPFTLPKVDRDLKRLLVGAELLVKPPLLGDVGFNAFEKFVSDTQKDRDVQFGWESFKLLKLALRTSSYCGKPTVARQYRAQLIERVEGLEARLLSPAIEHLFGGDQNWHELLEKEIEIGLSGNQVIEENRELLKKKGLVVSEIVVS